MSNIATGIRESERISLVRRSCNSLFWFARNICGYDLLTPEFHMPMMDEMDILDNEWAAGKVVPSDLCMWPRDYYKTTVARARLLRYIIRDPFNATIIYWHAVEEIAQESGVSIGLQLQKNKELWSLLPADFRPSVKQHKFATASGFNLPHRDPKQPKTMRMWGSGSEATGGKCRWGNLDDIIGHNTIEDSGMPKIRRWLGNTVENVVRTGFAGRKTAQGTHWDLDDIWMDLRKSSQWTSTVRACFETDGKPDINGDPVLYPKAHLLAKQAGMTPYQFSCQMMNEPLPDAERRWTQEGCEHFIDLREAGLGQGVVFILSDPAPAGGGSLSGVKESERGDSSKDYWAIAVVRIRIYKSIQQIVLLDGIASQDWPVLTGLEHVCRLMKKWQTPYFFNEFYGGFGNDYTREMLEVSPRFGVRPYLDTKKGVLPRFSDSHASAAKNTRMLTLADRAKRQQFLMCEESVPEEFLHGDGERVGFLPQMRNFRALEKGRNTLRWDDHADVTARSTDAALQEFAPRSFVEHDFEDPWLNQGDVDDYEYRSKYCAV